MDTSKDIAILVTAGKNINEEEDSIDVDPNDLCIICFERSKNAVFLECGHGGVCYNCAIDTCIVTGTKFTAVPQFEDLSNTYRRPHPYKSNRQMPSLS